MTIDLFLLGAVLFFALLGAMTGAARQIANLLALAASYFTARPLGIYLGPKVAQGLSSPLIVGTLAGTVLAFVVIYLAVRYVLTELLLRLFSGVDAEDRGLDRTLGFLVGGLRVAALAYVFLSALTFIERNVSIAGRKVGFAPQDSRAFALARSYNLFEMTQFAPVKDLVRVGRAAADPERAGRIQDDPAFLALKKDPRFARALKDRALREAIERGDTAALLRSDPVLQLIQDPDAAARLDAAAKASRR